jgi:hypothetical protein
MVDVSVPVGSRPRRSGIHLHRREEFGTTRMVRGIPVADPVSVLIDLAAQLATEEVEDAVNEADRLDLIAPTDSAPRSTESRNVPALVG